ncbi:hypothetical protein ACRE_087780 [Hapsidospora chrysogenum ATCC 11550]|uniref:Uncharacterized protein n=1 Tax=Hapsidospora chrysogenum (strain ATCC 11550 / CBS 779.69 / DSM 880 / IAM 14645 / JCM 23072 / IMI 49137) TaxID=857340 RepID=A0A086STU9_HAPC1|nr:hypothetical protein ACRE_087780 [Hapsidospora chrysogenum ATCC 11550]
METFTSAAIPVDRVTRPEKAADLKRRSKDLRDESEFFDHAKQRRGRLADTSPDKDEAPLRQSQNESSRRQRLENPFTEHSRAVCAVHRTMRARFGAADTDKSARSPRRSRRETTSEETRASRVG